MFSSTESDEGMAMLNVKVQPGSSMPERGSDGAAGYDVTAAETVEIPSGQTRAVDLNLSCQIPAQHYMQLQSRSGLASKGILVTGGVIDSDYRGPVKALLLNTTNVSFRINQGDKIAQAIFIRSYETQFHEGELEPAGFGSTTPGQ